MKISLNSVTAVVGMVIFCVTMFSVRHVQGQEPLPKSRWNEAREIAKQASMLDRKGNHEGARALRRKIVEEFQDVPSIAKEAQWIIGLHFEKNGDYDQALMEYEAVITKFPEERADHMQALTQMGLLYENKLYDDHKALEVYERMLSEYTEDDQEEGDPDWDGAKWGIQQIKQRLQVQAQEAISKNRWNEARETMIQSDRQYKKGDHVASLALRRKIVKEYKNVSFFAIKAQRAIARHYDNIGDYERAVSEFEAVITIFPENKVFHADALHDIGVLYEFQLHDLQKALAVHQRIVREFQSESKNDITVRNAVFMAGRQIERLKQRLKDTKK